MIRDGAGVFGALVVILLGAFLVESWIVMLLLGGIHHAVSASVPAVGFGGAMLLTAALGVLAGLFRPTA